MAILKDNTGNIATVVKFGGFEGVRRFTASKFIPSDNWAIESVDIRINEDTGGPNASQNIVIKILGNTGTVPNPSSVLGTGTLLGSTVGAIGAVFTNFNVPVTASLSNGVTYWLSLEINTEGSDANYWSSRAITTAASNNGAKFDEDNSGAWVNNTDDLYYSLNGTIGGGVTGSGSFLLNFI